MRAALLAAVVAACGTPDGPADPGAGDGGAVDDDRGDAAVDDRAIFADNGITLDNGLKLTNGADAGNGIKLTNGFDLSSGDDVENGIKLTNGQSTIEPPPGSDLETWIDVEPTMRLRILRYLVECALPAGSEVTVVYRGRPLAFPGAMALGVGWLDGHMSAVEQERVSACLIARVNIRGNVLRIMLVGPYPGLDSVTAADLAEYPNRESTVFGNLFADQAVGFVTNVGCGNRACAPDPGQASCSCGLLFWGGGDCVDNGLPYDTECTGVNWEQSTSVSSTNVMTTYVAEEWAGGPCGSDVDCIYFNCGADGVCGGQGASCNWNEMCAAPTGCGEDLLCAGRGARCGGDGDCLFDNCSLDRCGGTGATCEGDEACWGYNCTGGTCTQCAGDPDCPPGWVCWVGRCVPE